MLNENCQQIHQTLERPLSTVSDQWELVFLEYAYIFVCVSARLCSFRLKAYFDFVLSECKVTWDLNIIFLVCLCLCVLCGVVCA